MSDDPAGTSIELSAADADGDGELVVGEVRVLEPARPTQLPAVQAAAVAATGFVAGAATFAVIKRRLGTNGAARRAGRSRGRRGKAGELVEVVSSRSFLIDVHLLGRE